MKNKRKIIKWPNVHSDGLFDGNLGFSLCSFYDFITNKNDKSYDYGVSILNKTFENLQNESTLSNLSISKGLSGLGYVIEILKNLDLIDIELEEVIPGFDNLIFEMGAEAVLCKNFSFSNGVGGVLHYFNQKPESSNLNAQLINLLISGTKNDNGEFFYPSELIDLPRLGVAHPYINLGMSNGLSGIISVILNYYQHHPSLILKKYLYDALNFIRLHQKNVCFDEGRYSHFPSFIRDNSFNYGSYFKEWNKSRLAWCIGDLNMAYLFTKAGQLLNDEELLSIGNLTGFTTTSRKHGAETKVTDPFFCHGSSGLATVYRRLYEMTLLPHYYESYEYWLGVTNSYFKDKSFYNHPDGGLLNGCAGAQLLLSTQSLQMSANNWSYIFIP